MIDSCTVLIRSLANQISVIFYMTKEWENKCFSFLYIFSGSQVRKIPCQNTSLNTYVIGLIVRKVMTTETVNCPQKLR